MYTIYTKPNCPFCRKAKRLFTNNYFEFQEKDITDPKLREELLSRVPDAKTVPQIIDEENGTVIGGYEDFLKILSAD